MWDPRRRSGSLAARSVTRSFDGPFDAHGLQARRAHAVDTGYGQLLGSLRIDRRVVNLERTNVSDVDVRVVPDVVDLVTMDRSYTSIADGITALDALQVARTARLVALVKPTSELARSRVVVDRQGVATAIAAAIRSVGNARWYCRSDHLAGQHRTPGRHRGLHRRHSDRTHVVAPSGDVPLTPAPVTTRLAFPLRRAITAEPATRTRRSREAAGRDIRFEVRARGRRPAALS